MDSYFVTENFTGFFVDEGNLLIEFLIVIRIIEIQNTDLDDRLQIIVVGAFGKVCEFGSHIVNVAVVPVVFISNLHFQIDFGLIIEKEKQI